MMQEIIVYRNPMEAALWNSVSSGGFFPVFAGIVVFFAVFLTANALLDRFIRPLNWRPVSDWNSPYRSYAALVIAAIAAMFTIYKMWI